MRDNSCFGFFGGDHTVCDHCNMRRRCQAVTTTEGIEILASTVDALVEQLPDGKYKHTTLIRELVDQLTGEAVIPQSPGSGTPVNMFTNTVTVLNV